MSNMNTVAAFEAKTHFSSLLERAEHGEEITITRHGKAVARLLPIEDKNLDKKHLAAAKLKKIRELGIIKNKTEFEEWKNYRREGQK